jgi:putative FmdB family regulatory protein
VPTYDYKCDACGHAFEQFQSITADPIRKCPKCGKMKVKRLIGTGAGLIFKGSGFYITDYRDQAYQDKAKAESGAAESGAKKDAPKESGGDAAKPAATATETAKADKPAAAAAAAPKSDPKPSSSAAKKGKRK